MPFGGQIGIVDAHGGGVGCVGAALDDEGDNERHGSAAMSMSSRMALVCGTSTCHLASSGHAIFVPGVWGAFYSVMVPGLWLNEAGMVFTQNPNVKLALAIRKKCTHYESWIQVNLQLGLCWIISL